MPIQHRITSITSCSTVHPGNILSVLPCLSYYFVNPVRTKGLVTFLFCRKNVGSVLGTWKCSLNAWYMSWIHCGISEQRVLSWSRWQIWELGRKVGKLGSILHLVVTEVGVEMALVVAWRERKELWRMPSAICSPKMSAQMLWEVAIRELKEELSWRRRV